jgi:hypothetical protein
MRFGRLLHRIVQRPLPTRGSLEMLVGYLQVMLRRDNLRIAQPRSDEVQG